MSKHTPGPWAYENYGGTVHVFLDNKEGTPSICKLVGNDKDANARLIAAAPELLEALEELFPWPTMPTKGMTSLLGM